MEADGIILLLSPSLPSLRDQAQQVNLARGVFRYVKARNIPLVIAISKADLLKDFYGEIDHVLKDRAYQSTFDSQEFLLRRDGAGMGTILVAHDGQGISTKDDVFLVSSAVSTGEGRPLLWTDSGTAEAAPAEGMPGGSSGAGIPVMVNTPLPLGPDLRARAREGAGRRQVMATPGPKAADATSGGATEPIAVVWCRQVDNEAESPGYTALPNDFPGYQETLDAIRIVGNLAVNVADTQDYWDPDPALPLSYLSEPVPLSGVRRVLHLPRPHVPVHGGPAASRHEDARPRYWPAAGQRQFRRDPAQVVRIDGRRPTRPTASATRRPQALPTGRRGIPVLPGD